MCERFGVEWFGVSRLCGANMRGVNEGETAYTGLDKKRKPPVSSLRTESSCCAPCVTSLWSCR